MLGKVMQALAIIVVIAVVGFGLFYRPTALPSETETAHLNDDNSETSNSDFAAKHDMPATPVVSTQAPLSKAFELESTTHLTSLSKKDLSLAIQAEIQTLGLKNNDHLVVEQVAPNLMRASLVGIHQIVPVAVIDETGKVTIREY